MKPRPARSLHRDGEFGIYCFVQPDKTNMTKATRVQLKLRDSGSILYKDSADDIIFHIEAGDANADGKEAATTEVIKSFLRQHLLKNGESCHDVTPLMRTDSIGPLLKAVVGLHSRDQASYSAAMVCGIYKMLGGLVSLLQQREKVLTVAAEMVARVDAEADGGGFL